MQINTADQVEELSLVFLSNQWSCSVWVLLLTVFHYIEIIYSFESWGDRDLFLYGFVFASPDPWQQLQSWPVWRWVMRRTDASWIPMATRGHLLTQILALTLSLIYSLLFSSSLLSLSLLWHIPIQAVLLVPSHCVPIIHFPLYLWCWIISTLSIIKTAAFIGWHQLTLV